MDAVQHTLRGLPRTLLLTLHGRADEHRRPDGLFRDPLAAQWAARLPLDRDQAAWYSPRAQNGMAARTRQIDDLAARFLAAHDAARVVELGAGLSTRYQRVGRGCGSWVELDLPEAIALRRTLEDENEAHRFLACSLLDFAWMEQLPPATAADTLFIADGVLWFLVEAEVRVLVTAMRGHFPGAAFVFDVAGERFQQGVGDDFAAMDAPIRWTVRHLDEVAALGLVVIDVWPLVELFPERTGIDAANLPPAVRAAAQLIEARIQP